MQKWGRVTRQQCVGVLNLLLALVGLTAGDTLAPRLTPAGPKVTVTEHQNLTFKCDSSDLADLISWKMSNTTPGEYIDLYVASPSSCGQEFKPINFEAYFVRCSQDKKTFWLQLYNVSRKLHNYSYYCDVFVGQYLGSEIASLFVIVPVDSAELRHNDIPVGQSPIHVVNGAYINFTCITLPSQSRPTPTIDWYVGNNLNMSSTSISFSYAVAKSNHNEQVYCKAYNTKEEDGKESGYAKLYIEVDVSSVTLMIGNTVLNTNLTVRAGTSVNLTCTPDANSRPPPVIDWFIGSDKKKNSSYIYKLIPSDNDNGKTIYCKAYNSPRGKVVSKKPKLYVEVPVESAELWHNNLLVSSSPIHVLTGTDTHFTCLTFPSQSRPAPTIDWYVGTSHMPSIGTSFRYIATESDHNKTVYCRAYNTEKIEWKESAKAILFVEVDVSSVTLKLRNTVLETNLTVRVGKSAHLTCTPGQNSRPAPVVDWYIGLVMKKNSSYSYTLIPSNDDHNKAVYCKAYNSPRKNVVSTKPKLYVEVQVANVSLTQGNVHLDRDETVTVTAGISVVFTCTPGDSRPAPTIDWYIGSRQQLSSRSTNFTLNATNADHNETIYCKAYNLQKETESVESLKPKLYVKVPAKTPAIVNGTQKGFTFLEGDVYYLQCHSTATRPAANITWQIGSRTLSEADFKENIEEDGRSTVISTVQLNLSRKDHNTTITCRSKIPEQTNTPKTDRTVTVYWAPDKPRVVAVSTEFPWTEGRTGRLNCTTSESGNPSSSVIWSSNTGIKDTLTTLLMTNLSYKDNSRIVKCQLYNSFTAAKDLIIDSEDVELVIQFPPKVSTKETVVAGKPFENISIEVPFLVNPNDTAVALMVNYSVVNTSSKYRIVIGETFIEAEQKMGYQVHLTIFNLQSDDFTVYLLNLTNAVGTTMASVNLTAESSPLPPLNLKLLEQRGSTLILYWEKAFNGGHIQTFWIQITETGTDNWTNKTIVEEFDKRGDLSNGSFIANMTGLKPGIYNVRLIAVNEIGKAPPVVMASSIHIASTEKTPEQFPVGAAAGGGLGAAALIIIVVIVAFIWRRSLRSKLPEDDSKKNILTPQRQPNAKASVDIADIKLNPMYESSDAVQLPSCNADVYAKVNKQSYPSNPGPSSDVYSVVDKAKGKAKKSKPKDNTTSDVYSTPLKKGKGILYESAETATNNFGDADNVYENHACSSSDEKPSRTINDDGLIYIEVQLTQQKDAPNIQPVIHGEDRTVYADVAFGKVGEQMPEFDEEEKQNL